MQRKKAKLMQNVSRHGIITRSIGFGFWFGYYHAPRRGTLC